MKVVSIKDHDYAGVSRKIGDAYEADERFVATLRTVGYVRIAEIVEEEQPRPETPNRYKRRDMRAAK